MKSSVQQQQEKFEWRTERKCGLRTPSDAKEARSNAQERKLRLGAYVSSRAGHRKGRAKPAPLVPKTQDLRFQVLEKQDAPD